MIATFHRLGHQDIKWLEGELKTFGFFKTLSNIYIQIAQETVIRYENDAAINGLEFDRNSEFLCVDQFAHGIEKAGGAFWEDPSETVLIPNRHRITAGIPEFFSRLTDAVKKDNT